MHFNFTRVITGGSILLLAVTNLLFAQTPESADSTSGQVLDSFVITATRFDIHKDKLPQKLNLITKREIEMTPANDLTDIVRKLAAVDVIQYPNLSSGIGIRGFRPQFSGLNQRTLLLINGRPAGATNLSQINLNGIERIEVLKGPASSLYGSQAMGGVINVITRQSRGANSGDAFVEYGSFQTIQAGINSGGNLTKKLDYDLSFNYFERSKDYKIGKSNWLRDAFSYTTVQKNYSPQRIEEVDDRKDDGQRRPYTQLHYFSGALRLGYQLNNAWRIDVRGDKFQALNVESPGEISSGSTEASTKDVDRQSIDMEVSRKKGNHQSSIKMALSEENTVNYTLNVSGKPVIPFRSANGHNSWRSIQVKDKRDIGKHSLVFGYDYQEASTRSRRWTNDTTERGPTQPAYSLISSAFYVQGLINLGKFTIQPGIRYDNITFDVKQTTLLPTYKAGKETNPFVSPSLGVVYSMSNSLKVKANVGRAFVTTDAYSVAGYNEIRDSKGRIAVTAGNPNLKNESSISWDVAIAFHKPQSGLSGSITYFSTSVSNRIAKIITATADTLPNKDIIVSRASFVNAADATINGIEAEVNYDFGIRSDQRYAFKVFLNSTSLLKAREVIVGTDASKAERDIANVAKNTINFGFEYDSRKFWRVRLSGRSVGMRKDIDYTDTANPEVEYPNYMVLDLTASFRILPKHLLSLKVTNLTDENYYEKRGYNLPGRAINLRYTVSF